jgi:hypothetical protein
MFDRNASTGALTLKTGSAGCVAGLNTRNAVKRGRISMPVLTSFAATRTVAVSSVQNLILTRRR